MAEKNPLPITTEYIRLDSALKLSGVAYSGGEAKILIQEGNVLVNGEPCIHRGKKLKPGDTFSISGSEFEVVRE
ncbi:MAG: RNA-binding S4 domain-containing protein [Acutalibacteraceae bacterium]|jgi:ribosome-associated protein|nr:RNA-binding S4 domain-containing protein [Acutalibacteraceae bacterium]